MEPAPYGSIIIPTPNEAAGIGAAMGSAEGAFIEHEIIVVDAGAWMKRCASRSKAGAWWCLPRGASARRR